MYRAGRFRFPLGSTGARVLDLGCGAGYGTAELAGQAQWAVGVDVAPEAIAHARSAYALPKLCFLPASATALPFSLRLLRVDNGV